MKNPFASRLAEFDITLKLLRITELRYIVPIKFRFGRNRDFFGVTFIAVSWRTKRREALAFILPAQIIVKGIRRNGTAAIKTM